MDTFQIQIANKRQWLSGLGIRPGQVKAYARKSTRMERNVIGKSVAQQHEVNLRTALEWGLPLCDSDFCSEQDGHSGEEWWQGGGRSGIEGDQGDGGRTRPALTVLLRSVVRSEVKVIIVFSEDRLWRDVGICDALIDVFNRHGVTLVDRNGPVDISTPEGRAAVRGRAIAAQVQRDMASVNAKRGHRSNREAGRLTMNPECLGFRSCGRYSKLVRSVPDELQLVNRIFKLFLDGEGGGCPMTVGQIAKKLMAEGVSWPRDLQEKVSRPRNEYTRSIIYDWQVRKVLKDCRYQGRQPHGGKEWDCPAFLIEGEPAVTPAIYERAQYKLFRRKMAGNRASVQNPLAGLIRCGLCAQSVSLQAMSSKLINGKRVKRRYWAIEKSVSWSWCVHAVPSVREPIMEEFIARDIWPLLINQVGSIHEGGEFGRLLSLRAESEANLARLEDRLGELRQAALGALRNNTELVAEIDRSLRQEIHDARTSAALYDLELKRLEADLPPSTSFEDLTPAARSDAIRASIKWIALFKSSSERVRVQGDRTAPGVHQGYLVILTRWGSLITAMLELRRHPSTPTRRILTPRLAEAHEMVASVANFPDPEQFVRGLVRAHKTRRIKFDPQLDAPGYVLPIGLEAELAVSTEKSGVAA